MREFDQTGPMPNIEAIASGGSLVESNGFTEAVQAPAGRTVYDLEGLERFYERRAETLDAIGKEGQIQYATPWQQGERGGDGIDATLKIIRAKEAVDHSLDRLGRELVEVFDDELDQKYANLGMIETGASKGYVPEDVVVRHRQEVEVFRRVHEASPGIQRGMEVNAQKPVPEAKAGSPDKKAAKPPAYDGRTRKSPQDFEFTLATGETFYGHPAELVGLLSTRGDDAGFIGSDAIIHELWPNVDQYKGYQRLKRVVREAKSGVGDTPWRIDSRQGVHGGYRLVRKDD